MSLINVPVSIGELLDKLTILQIKTEKITDEKKLVHIHKELKALSRVGLDAGLDLEHELVQQLKKTNEALWKIEDDIRHKERLADFDQEFVELARAVYRTNDERFRIKSKLNEHYGSALAEQKSYEDY